MSLCADSQQRFKLHFLLISECEHQAHKVQLVVSVISSRYKWTSTLCGAALQFGNKAVSLYTLRTMRCQTPVSNKLLLLACFKICSSLVWSTNQHLFSHHHHLHATLCSFNAHLLQQGLSLSPDNVLGTLLLLSS